MSGTNALGAHVAVTAAYWAFMLTDGALRMLVLLHFHTLGFTPVQLAYLFVLYEIASAVTNLSAGWIAARYGLTTTLYAGLGLQIISLVALSSLDTDWTITVSVTFVMLVQGASGVAKDLAKMSSKSAVKLLAPEAQGGLFRWVAVLTGSKNAVKGIGHLVGAALLGVVGFDLSVLGMAGVLAIVLALVLITMPTGLPQGRKGTKFSEVLSKSSNVNWLSVARVFLFGARDVWFVVGVPIYFYAVLSEGQGASARDAFLLVGGFMASYVILYGAIQTLAPVLLRASVRPEHELVGLAPRWSGVLALVPALLAMLAWLAGDPTIWLTASLVGGLLVFCVLFAVNSSLHSYLILAFTENERVTMDVGFYYMANATGRLIGTLLSGLTYQVGGLPLCLGTAAAMLAISALAARRLDARSPRAAVA